MEGACAAESFDCTSWGSLGDLEWGPGWETRFQTPASKEEK